MSISIICELVNNTSISDDFFILQFIWDHHAPKAGQFFMIKPLRTSVFLPRPIGVFDFNHEQKLLKFLIARKGKGTQELSRLNAGEKVQLTGPVGNCWADFLPESGSAALVGGSAGVAPLAALVAEKPHYQFHFFAGFRHGFREKEQEDMVLGGGARAGKVVITAEDGKNALIGKIVDFIFDPQKFDIILGCGPMAMLNALKHKCESYNIPCFVSLETRMACGVGVCRGCSIQLESGAKCCCKDGPIFPAKEVIFNV